MTAEQAERVADLATFYFHDDRELVEVEVPQGPYAPSERAFVHTVATELGRPADE